MADMFAVDRLADMTGDLPSAGRAALLAGLDISLCDEAFTTLDALAETTLRSLRRSMWRPVVSSP